MDPLFKVKADILRAIGYMCPRLDRFIFDEERMYTYYTYSNNTMIKTDLWNYYDPSLLIVAQQELVSI